jgi:hypothetical protein
MGAATSDNDDFYLMANLRPTTTGLPMVVWVSYRGNAQHDVRVKVATVRGHKIPADNLISIGVRPQPHLIQPGTLSAGDFDAVSRWIALNVDAIVAYWDGAIDTVDLVRRLRRLE